MAALSRADVATDIKIFCQVWRRNTKVPVFVEVASIKPLGWADLYDPSNEGIMPMTYLLTCALPKYVSVRWR